MSSVPIVQPTDQKLSFNNNTTHLSNGNFGSVSLPPFQTGPNSPTSNHIRPKMTTTSSTNLTGSYRIHTFHVHQDKNRTLSSIV